MEYEAVTTIEALRDLYGSPMEQAVKKEQDRLDKHSIRFISLSPFTIIATSSREGALDASPRGEPAGFIQVIDETTIAIPDRPGNNRLDSLSNIVENPAIGMLLLVPGFKECLRINGSAKIVTNDALLARCEQGGKLPTSVIVVSIQSVYFHCAKAITRAQLWNSDAQVDRSEMPSLGRILMSQIAPEKGEREIRELEERIEHRVKHTLY